MQPNDTKYNNIQQESFENIRIDHNRRKVLKFGNLKCEREKRNFINEARHSLRTCTIIPSLKNAFEDCVSEPIKKANLLNYRLSKLGTNLGARNNFTDFLGDQDFTNIETFRFQLIGLFKCKTFLKQLN